MAITLTMQWTKLGAEAQIGGGDPCDWENDTVKLMLLDADFDEDTVEFVDDVSDDEVGGEGYPTGGYTLANVTVTSAAGPLVTIDADDIADTGVTLDATGATHAALYKDTTDPETSRIYAKGAFSENLDPDGGNLSIVWHANGILTAGTAA